MIGPVNRNLVAGPVTIPWPYIPPLLDHTERLGAINQPKVGTWDGILIFGRVSISTTLRNISQYLFYLGIVWMHLHLEN